MTYKNILIGDKPLFNDWIFHINKLNKDHIFVTDFSNSDNVTAIINEKQIDYILPLSKNDYDKIKNIGLYDDIILFPSKEIYDILDDKIKFCLFMIDNFPDLIPKTYYLDNTLYQNVEYPVISKPAQCTNGMGMLIHHDETTLNKLSKKYIVQQFIEDRCERAAYILCINGEIITSKLIKHIFPIHHIKTKNFPSNFQNDDDVNVDVFVEIIKKLNYSGGMCINFKYNTDNKKLDIFEINPRFGGSAFSNKFFYDLIKINKN